MTSPTAYRGPRCHSCDGPCWQYKGDVWGYTCSLCVNRHLDAAAARADARDHMAREKLLAKRLHNNNSPCVS